MADVIREFLVSLGYKVDPNSEKRFEASVRSATLQADLLGRAIAKSAEKVFEGVQQISKSFEQVYWQAQRTQATVQGIRAIGYAASQLGSSAEGAGASIENFGRQLKWNPGFEGFLKQLGVATRDSKGLRASTDTLIDFANRIKGRPKAEQLGLAEVAGIDLATLEAIQSGTFQKRLDEYNAKVKAQGLNSEEAAKRGAEFTQAMKSLGASLEIVGQKLMAEFAPALQRVVVAFDKWTNENGKSYVEFIEKVGRTLGELATVAEKVVSALKPIWEGFDNFSQKLTGQNGITLAVEALIGLKLAQWLMSVAAGIIAVGNAASAATIGGALTRFFGMLGIAGAGVGGLAYGGYKLYESDADFNSRRNAIENPGGRNPFAAIDEKAAKEKATREKAKPSLWERTKRFFGWGNDESPAGGLPGLSEKAAEDYANRLGRRESGNNYAQPGNQYGFRGRWQMGGPALADAGYVRRGTTNTGLTDASNWLGKDGLNSLQDFLANKGGGQDKAFAGHTAINHARMKKAGIIKDGMSEEEIAGWLAVAHLKGIGGAKQLQSGMDNYDANGTSASSYFGMMKGLKTGSSQKQGGPDLPPLARVSPTALGIAADNASKVGSGTGSASGATLTPSIASRGDTTVTINQNNRVEVVGSGDPSLTANQVGDAQRGLGQVLLRDVKGAVR
ncbi:hypothetical protein AB6806_27515 [Bosea sp. RCC_152_1]|uniref:hypothetical protein n=1 Tax=Bosea sp. RCC_152_1 TaxID=3239228 RepID=UPI003524D196